ncbi:cysteine desulfurase family protein [Carboxydochorda subterranea]|uniref:cysteine desulfurase n=1 Tax=Carboxydichorda subterranea TaxID=3109565 RepID=A0ABZ1BX94_9FIRM|nr:cysteine desulfurase family protein [Limnochorda sp. L945t]WRP17105.1 cysteine desulfurase family protein [Limnochorda sp. L945t]
MAVSRATDATESRCIYLDNASTTRVWPQVLETMARMLREDYGNPSSRHHLGAQAREAVEEARGRVAALVGAPPSCIYFTGSATEANNLAILGTAYQHRRQGRHLVATAIEHPSVLEPLRALEQEGFEVSLVRPGPDGVVSPDDVAAALRPDTILVSVMTVNNEVGSVQPVEAIVRAVRATAPHALVHSDMVQAAGKLPVDVRALGLDLASLSAHKLHGPKGIGALYVRTGVRLRPIVWGGGQERGVRSGTENVPAIAGFGVAAAIARAALPETVARLRGLMRRLREGLREAYPEVAPLGPQDEARRAPHILAAAFPGLRAEVLASHLDQQEGVAVSIGAACSSHKTRTSHVLEAMEVPPALAASAVRISLGLMTTEEEVDAAIRRIGSAARDLKAFLASGGRRGARA